LSEANIEQSEVEEAENNYCDEKHDGNEGTGRLFPTVTL